MTKQESDMELTKIEDLAKADAILCRTNAGCVVAAIEAGAAGRTFALMVSGGIQSMRSFANGAKDLLLGHGTDHPDLSAFKDWREAQEFAGSDEGKDLRPMVRIVDKYGVPSIIDICNKSLPEKDAHEADVQIVTIHRSKGLEWDHVLIFPDFTPPKESSVIPLADVRLAYVAVTRARLTLDATAVAWMLSDDFEVR